MSNVNMGSRNKPTKGRKPIVPLIRIYGGFQWIENGKTIAKPRPADPGLQNEIDEVVVPKGYEIRWYGKEVKPGFQHTTDYKLVKSGQPESQTFVRHDAFAEMELAVIQQSEKDYEQAAEKLDVDK